MLGWSCSDPDGDPLTYDVYFGTVNPPDTMVSSNQTGTTFGTSGLSGGTTYYWKVVAREPMLIRQAVRCGASRQVPSAGRHALELRPSPTQERPTTPCRSVASAG